LPLSPIMSTASLTSAETLHDLARRVGETLLGQARMLVTAESCTGGGVGFCVTGIAGSSQWYERGFVTYSNAAKQELLGVDGATLGQWGAVSEAVAREMAAGALANSHGDVAVAVTGIAGPDGGSAEKPVGTVCLAWQLRGQPPRSTTVVLDGDRESVRLRSIMLALAGVLDLVQTDED